VSQYTELTTERLRLRAPLPADAAAIVRYAGDERVARTTLDIPHPYSDAAAAEFIRSTARWWDEGEGATWSITTRGDGAVLGCIGLTFVREHRRAELGYWIGHDHWGRGYATEAARAVVEWAFANGWERITAGHFAGNEASGRVLEKAGFQREGLLRSHYVRFGDPKDLVFYARLRDDR
jgi:ribosomal-protein-alanine N-acetyltransferase